MNRFLGSRIRFISILFLMFAGIFFFNSCKTYRKKQSVKRQGYNSDTVISHFKAQEFNFNKLEAKLNVSTDIDGKKQSFTANIRMKKDSIIWISVSPFLGIEVVRLVLTPDSAKALNRLENTYFLSDNTYLKTLLKADIDFKMLQSVITGNDFPHFEKDVFDVSKEDSAYLLTAGKRYKLEDNKKSSTVINQVITLNSETFKIIKNIFNDIEEKYKFEMVYSNFKMTDNRLFSTNMECKIKTGNQLWNITVIYSKLNLNVDSSYPFTIPDNYTKMP